MFHREATVRSYETNLGIVVLDINIYDIFHIPLITQNETLEFTEWCLFREI